MTKKHELMNDNKKSQEPAKMSKYMGVLFFLILLIVFSYMIFQAAFFSTYTCNNVAMLTYMIVTFCLFITLPYIQDKRTLGILFASIVVFILASMFIDYDTETMSMVSVAFMILATLGFVYFLYKTSKLEDEKSLKVASYTGMVSGLVGICLLILTFTNYF